MRDDQLKAVKDLISNPSFREWALGNPSPDAANWENLSGQDSENAEILDYAKAIVYSLTMFYTDLPDKEVDEEIRKIVARTKTDERPEQGSPLRSVRSGGFRPHGHWWKVAALIIAGVFSWYYFQDTRQQAFTPVSKSIVRNSGGNSFEYV